MNARTRNVARYNIVTPAKAAEDEAAARAKGLPIVRVNGETGYAIGTHGRPGWVRVRLFGYTGQDAVVKVWHTEVVAS